MWETPRSELSFRQDPRQDPRRDPRQRASENGRFEHESGPQPSGRPSMSGAFRAIDPASAQERDPDRLYWLDRACLRFLLRCGAATAKQIAILVYGNLRLAQYHLLRLHRSGLLERDCHRRYARSSRVRLSRQSIRPPAPRDQANASACHIRAPHARYRGCRLQPEPQR